MPSHATKSRAELVLDRCPRRQIRSALSKPAKETGGAISFCLFAGFSRRQGPPRVERSRGLDFLPSEYSSLGRCPCELSTARRGEVHADAEYSASILAFEKIWKGSGPNDAL